MTTRTQNNGRLEHFIPIRKSDLERALTEDPLIGRDEKGKLLHLFHLLEATIHYEHSRNLETLKTSYGPFDPDSVAKPIHTLNEFERKGMLDTLYLEFDKVLKEANYIKLRPAEVEKAQKALSDFGVRESRRCRITKLEVYSRGAKQIPVESRRDRKASANPKMTDAYERLVVIFRLIDNNFRPGDPEHDRVYIKIFKDVPKSEMDWSFPRWNRRMPLLALLWMLLPLALGAVVTGYGTTKFDITQGALEFAVAGAYAIIGIFFFAYSGVLYVRYQRKKEDFHAYRTMNLYLKNLVNNVGVLLRLLDDAEDQEFRETFLAYFLLSRNGPKQDDSSNTQTPQNAGAANHGDDDPPKRSWSKEQLHAAAGEYLLGKFGIRADFEIDDSIRKLKKYKLIKFIDEDRFRATSTDKALVRLDKNWDELFPFFNEHARREQEKRQRTDATN